MILWEGFRNAYPPNVPCRLFIELDFAFVVFLFADKGGKGVINVLIGRCHTQFHLFILSRLFCLDKQRQYIYYVYAIMHHESLEVKKKQNRFGKYLILQTKDWSGEFLFVKSSIICSRVKLFPLSSGTCLGLTQSPLIEDGRCGWVGTYGSLFWAVGG